MRTVPDPSGVNGVGASAARFDAVGKVSGATAYPGDRLMSDTLTAKLVFTNQPHARLRSLDVSAARVLPGVVAVFTAADVPVNEYGLTLMDQPVFIGLDHTGRSRVDPTISRWEADGLALVVAETADAAHAAAAAIEVTWEPLPILPDIDAALASDVRLHPENGNDSNVYTHYKIRKGDMAAGWAAADVVIDHNYEFPYQEHAYLQPEAGVSYIDDDGRVTVEIAGQWTHEDRIQIAHALDLRDEQVRVIYPAIGGAFGGREDTSLQIVLSLATWRLAQVGELRPIRCQWSREESIVGHHKRHRGRVRSRLGATNDGLITAVEVEAYLDAGGYNYTSNKVLGNLHLGVAGCYEVPNAQIDSMTVYTNAAIGGAFRGFGGPQAAFVAESQINKLAEALGLDPLDVRRRNLLRDDSTSITQCPLPARVTLADVLEACSSAIGFDQPMAEHQPFSPFASLPPQPDALRCGRGIALAFKNVGFSNGFEERCVAEIHLHGDGDTPDRADLFHAGADLGQGAHQVLLQMAAEATGVPLEAVSGHFSDSASAGDSGSTSASRMTWMGGNSVIGAAQEAEKQWLEGARPAVGRFRFTPPPTDELDAETGAGQPNFSYGYVAQAVELTVDTETGHVVVDRVVSAHDVGRAINPGLVVGQIEGGVVQAHGYVLSEDLQVEAGKILNPRLSTYLIPGIGDVPGAIDSVVLELADPLGPWGARGMAEMPMMTYAPAVIAAVHDATGVWFNQFPLTPSRVLAGLRAHQTASAEVDP